MSKEDTSSRSQNQDNAEQPDSPVETASGRPYRRRLNTKLLAILIAGVSGLVILGVGFGVGYFVAPHGGGAGGGRVSSGPAASSDSGPTIWTCSMHPQIKLPKPGKCPICFMDLIPLEHESSDELGPRQLRMSETAARLAEIETSLVKRQYVDNLVRMVGKVEFDETRVADITAWAPGRLDRLFVDYTGVTVRKGDHLVEMYSPELIVAQRELIEAMKSADRLGSFDRELAMSTRESAAEKLRLLGLLPKQIAEIKHRGQPTDQLTIYSPIGGVVIEKLATEGMYVKTGTTIYRIADLSTVWVFLEAYESDLPWLRYGQQVEFTTEAYPGETFHGRIAFIDPLLDDATRTVQVRVNVPNADGRLKPGMFVRAIVRSHIAAGGKVFDSSLAGKWISPMHPEIVKNGPGKCDICGMDLVPAEQLGYVISEKAPEMPLVIPATAPLITGKRAVVYVQLPDRKQPTFEGREILLGPRAGDFYLVRQGLEQGDRVVTNGNFKIDSALQILAKPSMMNPTGGVAAAEHQHGGISMAPMDDRHAAHGAKDLAIPPGFQAKLKPVYESYLSAAAALADDQLTDTRRSFGALRQAVDRVDASVLQGSARKAWQSAVDQVNSAFVGDWQKADIKDLRKRFEPISDAMLATIDAFGHAGDAALHRAFCPMAFGNKGAAWLQAGEKIANPYFGHKMLRCGEIQRDFPPVDMATANEPAKEAHHEH